MKKLALILLVLNISVYCEAQSTVLFSVEQGMENQSDKIAVPFVVYASGKYSQPASCEIGATAAKQRAECNKAKKTLEPLVQKGKQLFVIIDGKQSGSLTVSETVEFAVTDWMTYSGKLEGPVNVRLLANNPSLGLKKLKAIKTLPKLKVRKDTEGMLLKNELIGKLDVDGDGYAELIYQCADYEGYFYEIYSFKNNSWKKVYSGGYQGA